MPILREPSDDAPLTQGDVLQGVPLFATKPNWGEAGGSHYRVKSPLCMVISRPCAITHKLQVIASAVEKIDVSIPRELDELRKVREWLKQLRDGDGNPDRFYLGQQIPGFQEQGRFYARLDSLHTLKLPADDRRPELLRSCRIATLSEEFRRDLHRRVFSSIATLGFDDYGWYPAQDLEWVIAVGEKQLSTIQSKIDEKKAEIKKNVAAGQSERNRDLKARLRNLIEQADKLRSEIEPFQAEQEKRGSLDA